MILDPARLADIPTYDLLDAAARGHVGIDHRFLHAILDNPEKSLPDLLRFAMRDREDDRLDLEEDLIAIFRHLQTPEALPFYLDCVRRYPSDITDELVEAFTPLREQAVEPLAEVYGELEEEQASDVAFLLASLGVRHPRILEILLDRLHFDVSDGAFCLGLYADPAARPALEKLLEEIPDQPDNAAVRREIAEALERLGEARREEPPAPFDIWSLYPPEAGPQFAILTDEERLEFLDSQDPEIRGGAVESLGKNQELSRAATDKLVLVARNDPDPSIRGKAWESLSAAVEEKEIREAMVARLSDASVPLQERAGALVGLAGEMERPEVRRWVAVFYELPATRAKALEAMWRSFDRGFADYFPGHLDDPDPEIRLEAIWGCGYLGVGSAAKRLREYFDDEEHRSDALFAYALSVPADVNRQSARSLLRKIEESANGLSLAEAEMVEIAIDQRLVMHGLEPVFTSGRDEDEEIEAVSESVPENPAPDSTRIGRNEPCPCGSGKKYKKCCGSPISEPK